MYQDPDDFRGMLPDHMIRKYVESYSMITPYSERMDAGVISYGLSSYGYDARLAPEFKVFKNREGSNEIDPKTFSPSLVETIEAESILVPAHGFVLATTLEYFKLPAWVMSVCIGKSTYARCGLYVNTTPVEPGTRAQITLELANATDVPIRIYANEGICQFMFWANDPCDKDYKAAGGKYMYQRGVTLPRLKE